MAKGRREVISVYLLCQIQINIGGLRIVAIVAVWLNLDAWERVPQEWRSRMACGTYAPPFVPHIRVSAPIGPKRDAKLVWSKCFEDKCARLCSLITWPTNNS
jgi:hypothetical protein